VNVSSILVSARNNISTIFVVISSSIRQNLYLRLLMRIYKDYTKTFDKTSTEYENFLILGDLNYDMLVNEKCTAMFHRF
jgi:hypothetical protein